MIYDLGKISGLMSLAYENAKKGDFFENPRLTSYGYAIRCISVEENTDSCKKINNFKLL